MKIKACLWTMFAVCVGSLCHVSAQPSVDDYLARTADQYHFSQWGGRTRVSYTAPLSAWHLPVLSVPTNGMRIEVFSSRRDFQEKIQICSPSECLLWVQALKYPDVLSAHKAILYRFSTMQSTYDYSSATNDFGDRSYSTNNFAVFARNNICITVKSWTNAIPAEAVARQIDADILRKSTASE